MKWISVRDNLPEDGRVVLAIHQIDGVPTLSDILFARYYTDGGWWYDRGDCRVCEPDEIIFWAELPEYPDVLKKEIEDWKAYVEQGDSCNT